jgi:hypothetical protein
VRGGLHSALAKTRSVFPSRWVVITIMLQCQIKILTGFRKRLSFREVRMFFFGPEIHAARGGLVPSSNILRFTTVAIFGKWFKCLSAPTRRRSKTSHVFDSYNLYVLFPKKIHVQSLSLHRPHSLRLLPLKLAHSQTSPPSPVQFRYTCLSSRSSSSSVLPRSKLCRSASHPWHPMDGPMQSRHLLGSSSYDPDPGR